METNSNSDMLSLKTHRRLISLSSVNVKSFLQSVMFNLPRLLEKYTLTGHGNTSISMYETTYNCLHSSTDASRLMPNTAVYSALSPFPSHGVRDNPSVRLSLGSFRSSFVATGECLVASKQLCCLFPFVVNRTNIKLESRMGFVGWQACAGSIFHWPSTTCVANFARVKTMASITNIGHSLSFQFVSVSESAAASLSNESVIGTSVSQYLQFSPSVVRWLRVNPRIRNFLEYFSSRNNLHQPFLSVTEIPWRSYYMWLSHRPPAVQTNHNRLPHVNYLTLRNLHRQTNKVPVGCLH